jgi:hypothetical protein
MHARTSSILFAASLAATSPLFAAPVFQANFDGPIGATSGAVTGITGGTATLFASGTGASATITDTSPLAPGGGGYLNLSSVQSGGVNISPIGGSGLDALSAKVGTQAVLQGGFDFFFFTHGNGYSSSSTTNNFRPLDSGTASATAAGGLRITMANTNTVSPVELIIRNASASPDILTLRASTAFSFAANTLYHVGVTFTNDGTSSQAHLFVTTGNTAIADLTPGASNPQWLASSVALDFANDNSAFAAGQAFQFGRAPGSTQARTQSFDQFRIYSTAPTSFSAIPEPSSLALVGIAALLGVRRRRK